MKFKLNIEMGGTVRDADDVAALLVSAATKVALKVGEEGESGVVRDDSNAPVGSWEFTNAEDPVILNVGDPDPTRKLSNRECGQVYHDSDGDQVWICTSSTGHDGLHIAGNGRVILALWRERDDR